MLKPEEMSQGILRLGQLMANYDNLEEKLEETVKERDELKNKVFQKEQDVVSISKSMNEVLDELMDIKDKLEMEID